MEYPCVVVAIDLGGTKIAGALVRYESPEAAPSIIMRDAVPTAAARGGEAVLADVCELAAKLAAASELTPCGVGVAAAGCIDPNDGSVGYANAIMPGWMGQPLSAAVAHACGLPAAALGDVQGHALGEARWGAAKEVSAALMVAVGTGLGGAIIVDGKVLRGAHGAAGHLGHTMHYSCGDYECACGAPGHVESVTCGTGIGTLYQGVSLTDDAYDPALDGAEVSRRAEAGEKKAIETIHDAGFALGEACGCWANMLDPELIILSGTVTNAGPEWRRAVGEGFARHALEPLHEISIVPAELGSDAPLIGAAEHLLDSLK